jgi:hypothetical protein
MAKIEFNIPSLIYISQTMGYIPQLGTAINRLITSRDKVEYDIALQEATELALGYEVTNFNEMKDYGVNPNATFGGVPLFQPLVLKGETEQDDDLLLDSAVLSYNLSKNIVKTEVQGRDGTVKEFINNGDYVINFSGLLCEGTWSYPIRQVVEFDRFMKRKTPITVEHEVLNALGVYQIVVEGYDCPKTPNFNCQIYSFSAVSETPIQLQINSQLINSANI